MQSGQQISADSDLTCGVCVECAMLGAGNYHPRNYRPPAAMQGSREPGAPAGTKVEVAAVRPTVKRGMCSRGMSYAEAAASMPPPGNSTPPGSSMSAVIPWSSHSSTSSPAKCCKPPLSTAGSKSGIRGTVENSRPTRHFFRTGPGIGAGGAGAHPILGVASPSNVVRGDAGCAEMLTFEGPRDSASVEDSKYSAGGGADAGADATLGIASPWTANVAGSTVKKMPLKQPRGPRGVNSNPGLSMLKQAHARMHARMHARPWSIRGTHAILPAQARGLGPEGLALIRFFAARPHAHPHKRTYTY
jgi:hypothetical protein